MKLKATPQVVEDYKKLFVNRRAYTMQSLRPHSKTGRHYYFRPNKRGVAIDADYRHAKIKVPTLIIVGDHDESDPKMSKEMQEKIA